MAYKKNDRVSLTIAGAEVHGTVGSVRAGLPVVDLDDGRRTKPVDPSILRPSSVPGPVAWARLDRVAFEPRAGEVVHGTVLSIAGGLAKVMADGGDVSYKVPPAMLRASDKVIPLPEPSAMDRWGVRDYRRVSAMSEETDAFTAVITLDGKPVMHAKNDGRGGSNMYHPAQGATYETVRAFEADAKAWGDEVGWDFEPSDAWLTWHENYRPYAVDAKAWGAKNRAEMDEMMGGPRP